MSTTTTAPKLTLTTPSLGVQQWRDDDSKGTTRIAWASTGGRGLPRTLMTLPVVPEDGPDGPRWAPPPALMDELERDPRPFWRRVDGCPLRRLRRALDDESVQVGMEDRGNDPAAPRATSMADDCGAPWGAHHLVVLLVFDEPPGIGEPGDTADAFGSGQLDDAAVYCEEVEAIKTFFHENYDQRLVTRGLVRLPPLSPARAAGDVVFALASCQYPADMTDGAPNDHRGPEPPASAALLRLSRLLTPMTPASPSLLVLAGDQVYVDATASLFDARSQNDRLRLPYQNLMGSPGAQSVFGLLPVAMILDDHELVDNWEPGAEVPADAAPDFIVEGVRAYRRFQRMAGPPLRDSQALWCKFTHFGVPFFLADTRTKRGTPDGSPRRVDNWREAHIMDRPQWDALRTFLLDNRDQVSFVVSPSMLLPRRLGLGREPSLALDCDSWDGFPASRHELLALLCENDLKRVVFLSGDAHISCVAQATVTSDGHCATLWSVHSSGLYCPYPFANGSADNYACDEVFHFRWGGPTHKYRCAIERVTWAPGDGFATLTLTRSGGSPQGLRVSFHRANDDNIAVPLF